MSKHLISVTYDKNTVHKLTVAHDGNIRIKVAKGTNSKESADIIKIFTKVGKEACELGKGTLRGKLKPDELGRSSITLFNDSKKEHYSFDFVTCIRYNNLFNRKE